MIVFPRTFPSSYTHADVKRSTSSSVSAHKRASRFKSANVNIEKYLCKEIQDRLQIEAEKMNTCPKEEVQKWNCRSDDVPTSRTTMTMLPK